MGFVPTIPIDVRVYTKTVGAVQFTYRKNDGAVQFTYRKNDEKLKDQGGSG